MKIIQVTIILVICTSKDKCVKTFAEFHNVHNVFPNKVSVHQFFILQNKV